MDAMIIKMPKIAFIVAIINILACVTLEVAHLPMMPSPYYAILDAGMPVKFKTPPPFCMAALANVVTHGLVGAKQISPLHGVMPMVLLRQVILSHQAAKKAAP